jgi:hypothetical protein
MINGVESTSFRDLYCVQGVNGAGYFNAVSSNIVNLNSGVNVITVEYKTTTGGVFINNPSIWQYHIRNLTVKELK